MTFNVSAAQFGSDFAIDKIQSWSTQTDASSGLQPGYSVGVPVCTSIPAPQSGTGTISNPYGRRGLPNLTWSLDKVNWYPNGGQILYFNSDHQEYITQVALYATCSDSTITIVVTTGYTSPQTVYLQLAVDNPI